MVDATRAWGAVDVHSHVVPPDFPAEPPGAGAWPCLACRPDGRRVLEFAGKPFRRLDDRSWGAAARVADMDRDGIATQIVSPMPELFSYGLDPAKSAALCDVVNAATAALVAEAPRRFAGLGIVTMQAPELAVRQLSDLRARFGLIGIEIGSNIAGVHPGDPRFHPVYEAAAALGMIVFVHAFHPLSAGSGGLAAAWTPFVGFATDVGLAAASFIAHDVPARAPGLHLLFSHGGGTLAAMLGRLDRGFAATDGFGGTLSRRPREVANAFFYDSNTYDPALLRHLATEVAPGRVMLGTDYPYDIMQRDPLPWLAAGMPAALARDVAGAGRTLLDLHPSPVPEPCHG